jgi:hypothetical protein
LQDACVPATPRPSDGARACRQAVNAILNRNPQTCYIVSAQRLKHAAGQPGPWGPRMAAAIRDLDHVHLPLHDIDAERLDDAMSLLREHAPLRGLAITRSLFWCRPVETALAEVLQLHKDRLEDLSLTLPLGFPPALTEAIEGLGGLQSLSLHNPPESPADAGSARRLAEALGSLPKLRSLAVTGFSDAAALTACLPRLPHLESLRISECTADCKDWPAIAGNLQGLQAATGARLRHLELSFAKFGDAGIVPLAPVLSGMHGLHELALAGSAIGPAGMAMLSRSLEGMKELKILDLSGNRLHGAGITSLAGALEELPQLQELHLLGAGLTGDDIGPLGAALRGSPRLQSLSLSSNRLSGGDAAGWAALLGAAKLESLRLNGCAMDSEDVAPLAAGLVACPTLKTLDLTGNSADMPEDVEWLTAGLACLGQLETCRLPVLGKEGLRMLLPVLQALQGCSLRRAVLSPADAELADELRSNLPGMEVS